MSIYRGPGGAGDATTDSTSQAIISVEAAAEAEASAAAAAGSATSASTSASNAATSATNAANSASSASTSATSASNSASAASTSATAAQTAETNAETAQTAAELAETNAETAATNAANSASAASTSATNAASSASAASTSATSAASSASTATTQATNASNSATAAASSATSATTSATNAASSATSASNSATSASTSASTATTQATNAASSATAAATSASSASTSATNASNSASSASTSATNASNSASSASTSATNAASSAAAAAASYDDFDDRYLGPKASAPTLDNDGNALQTGALYFNTSTSTMKVYNGTTWLDAYASLSGALLATNNLSDLNNVATARTNLGLGTAALVADNTLVHLAGTETITGAKTFSSTITGSITGNAGTVTNGVYTSGSYADPTWITSIAGSKVSGNISGNAATATTATNQSGGTVAATTGSFSSSVTLSGGTANGVAYLNGSKVLTTGSALTFDTAQFKVDVPSALGGGNNYYCLIGNTSSVSRRSVAIGVDSSGDALIAGYNNFSPSLAVMNLDGSDLRFKIASSEQMRLTSTGLGIGTSSPSSPSGFAKNVTLYDSSSAAFVVNSGGSYRAEFATSSSGGWLGTWDSIAMRFATGGNERMRIDSSGNMGIGTSSPSVKLDVNGIINSNGSGAIYYKAGTWNFLSNPTLDVLAFGGISASQWDTLSFYTSASERMRIDSSGNLLVGTTATAASNQNGFTVEKYAGGVYINVGHNGDAASGDSYIHFRRNGTSLGSITQVSSTGVAYNTSSDYRLKENIQPMQSALATVAQLNPVTYTWKADGSDGQGFIAHELQAVVPDCVTGEKDAVDAEGKPVYQGIDTSFLVATLTKAIQEQQEQINQLKAEVAALKGA